MSLFWQKPSRDVWWMNNNAKFKYNATTHETAVITANIHHAVDVQCNVYHAYRCTAQPYYLYFNWFCWKLKQQKIIKQYTVFINLIRVHLMQKATCMYTNARINGWIIILHQHDNMTTDVGTRQIKMVSVKMETCHMGRILQQHDNTSVSSIIPHTCM